MIRGCSIFRDPTVTPDTATMSHFDIPFWCGINTVHGSSQECKQTEKGAANISRYFSPNRECRWQRVSVIEDGTDGVVADRITGKTPRGGRPADQQAHDFAYSSGW